MMSVSIVTFLNNEVFLKGRKEALGMCLVSRIHQPSTSLGNSGLC